MTFLDSYDVINIITICSPRLNIPEHRLSQIYKSLIEFDRSVLSPEEI